MGEKWEACYLYGSRNGRKLYMIGYSPLFVGNSFATHVCFPFKNRNIGTHCSTYFVGHRKTSHRCTLLLSCYWYQAWSIIYRHQDITRVILLVSRACSRVLCHSPHIQPVWLLVWSKAPKNIHPYIYLYDHSLKTDYLEFGFITPFSFLFSKILI